MARFLRNNQKLSDSAFCFTLEQIMFTLWNFMLCCHPVKLAAVYQLRRSKRSSTCSPSCDLSPGITGWRRVGSRDYAGGDNA